MTARVATKPPRASSEDARLRMVRQRRRDTLPELAIRRHLHALGYRYRVDFSLPGTRRRADIAFVRRRVVVFVDGCFWHSCPVHATRPRRNAKWWSDKLSKNISRDRDTDQRLLSAGWRVLRVWEHEEPYLAVERIVDSLRQVL